MVSSKFNKVISLALEKETFQYNLFMEIAFYNDIMVWDKTVQTNLTRARINYGNEYKSGSVF